MQEKTFFEITLNHYLSLGALIGSLVLVSFALYVAFLIYKKKTSKLIFFIEKNILSLSFTITFVGMSLSLFYSEFLKEIPCDLCWFQRIFMYSQVFLFGFAWYKKDKTILPYTFLLSFVGFSIASYHHLLQIGYDVYKPCSTSPFAVDCAKPTFVEFGFVTFPFMAVVLFGSLLLLGFTANYFAKKK